MHKLHFHCQRTMLTYTNDTTAYLLETKKNQTDVGTHNIMDIQLYT